MFFYGTLYGTISIEMVKRNDEVFFYTVEAGICKMSSRPQSGNTDGSFFCHFVAVRTKIIHRTILLPILDGNSTMSKIPFGAKLKRFFRGMKYKIWPLSGNNKRTIFLTIFGGMKSKIFVQASLGKYNWFHSHNSAIIC